MKRACYSRAGCMAGGDPESNAVCEGWGLQSADKLGERADNTIGAQFAAIKTDQIHRQTSVRPCCTGIIEPAWNQ